MHTKRQTLLTVVADATMESEIVQEFHDAGVRGFTAVEAVGVGRRGQRVGDVGFNRSLRIEIVCDRETATQLGERLLERLEPEYAIAVWLKEVEVLAPRMVAPTT